MRLKFNNYFSSQLLYQNYHQLWLDSYHLPLLLALTVSTCRSCDGMKFVMEFLSLIKTEIESEVNEKQTTEKHIDPLFLIRFLFTKLESSYAAKKAIAQVVFSRISMAVPGMHFNLFFFALR